MELQQRSSPHIRYHESATSTMRDTIIALVPLILMAIYYYGLRALVIVLISILTCDTADRLCLIFQKKQRRGNFSAIITGIIIALLLPASVPYFVVIVAGLFAILIVKHPFGGLGNNIFNPACSGIAFVLICWPERVLSYPEPLTRTMELVGTVTTKLGPSLASVLKEKSASLTIQNGVITKGSLINLLIGNYRGPMGATCVIVVLASFLFLLSRKAITWHGTASYFVVATIFSILFPRIESYDMTLLTATAIEVLTDSLLFAGVFIVSEPVTSPSFRSSKIIYGAGAGVLTMIFRRYGQYPEGVMFAILAMNTLSGYFDKIILDRRMKNGLLKRIKETVNNFLNNPEYIQLKEELKLKKEEENKTKSLLKEELKLKKEEENKTKSLLKAELKHKKEEEDKTKSLLKAEKEKARLEKEEKPKLEKEEKAKLEKEEKPRLEKEEKPKLEKEDKAKLDKEEGGDL